MSDGGFSTAKGDRQPVSFCWLLVCVSACFTYGIGISSFSLIAGSNESGQYRLAISLCAIFCLL